MDAMSSWKRESYSHKPRAIVSRTNLWDVFDSEAYYQDRQVEERAEILKFRDAANLMPEFLESTSSWFNSDDKTAYVTHYESNYLVANRIEPRHQLTKTELRAKNYPRSEQRWSSLERLEKEIAEFLLMRNDDIIKSRPEHLNDPVNFFFWDLKNIARKMALRTNPQLVLDALTNLEAYISKVDDALAKYDDRDQDRLFLDQVRTFIRRNVKTQIQTHIESVTIRENLKSLGAELKDIAERVNAELHYRYQDGVVAHHPLLPTEKIEASDRHLFPTHALISCAQRMLSASREITGKSTSLMSFSSLTNNPFFKSVSTDGKFEADPAFIDHCEDVKLYKHMSQEDKQLYVSSLNHLVNLLNFAEVLQYAVSTFEEAGQYQMVLENREDLSYFLKAMALEIKATQGDIETITTRNKEIENTFLTERLESSTVSKVFYKLTGSLGLNSVDVDQFIENKVTRNAIKSHSELFEKRDPFQQTAQDAEGIISMIDKAHSLYQQDKLSSHSSHRRIAGKSSELTTDERNSESMKQRLSGMTSMVEEKYQASIRASESVSMARPKVQTTNPELGVDMECHPAIDQAQQTQVLHCSSSADYDVYVYPKVSSELSSVTDIVRYEGVGFQPERLTGDFYTKESCKPTTFHHTDAIYCEGEKTSMFYVPRYQQNGAQVFFDQLGAQVALGMVMYKAISNTYHWFVDPVPPKVELSFIGNEDAHQFFSDAYQILAKLNVHKEEHTWLESRISEFRYDLELMDGKFSKGTLDIKSVEDFTDELEYCIDSITEVVKEDVLIEQQQAKQNLLQKSKLTEQELEVVIQYFSGIGAQSKLDEVTKDKLIQAKYDRIQQHHQYDSEDLLNVATWGHCIAQLTDDPTPVMKTDVSGLHEEINGLVLTTQTDVTSNFKSDVMLLRQKPYHVFQSSSQVTKSSEALHKIGFFSQLGTDCRHMVPPSQTAYMTISGVPPKFETGTLTSSRVAI